MREVKRNALVKYSPAQMFALVEDFERYPEFLPWVSAAKLLSRDADQLTGRLEMERLGVKELPLLSVQRRCTDNVYPLGVSGRSIRATLPCSKYTTK